MPPLPRAVSALVAAGLLLSACTSASDGPEGAGGAGGTAGSRAGGTTSPSPSTGPGQAHLDLSGLTVPRADICDLIGADDAEQALAGPVARTAHYGNGEEVEVTPGRVDISHEEGCVYVAGDGTVARTWIFARPVPPQEARALVRQARSGRECAFPESVRFGRPSLTSVCEVTGVPDGLDGPSGSTGPDGQGDLDGPDEAAVRARLEGLFGDTWMGCEVSEPVAALEAQDGRADVVQRAEQWCTDVVTAVSAGS